MGGKNPISWFELAFMLMIAGVFDFLQFVINFLHLIPVIGNTFALGTNLIVSILGFFLFLVWFGFHGTVLLDPRKPGRMLARLGIIGGEVLPLVSSLPLFISLVIWAAAETNKGKEGQPFSGASKPTQLPLPTPPKS